MTLVSANANRTDATNKTDASDWFAHLVGRQAREEELKAFEGFDETTTVGLILASPAFQRC